MHFVILKTTERLINSSLHLQAPARVATVSAGLKVCTFHAGFSSGPSSFPSHPTRSPLNLFPSLTWHLSVLRPETLHGTLDTTVATDRDLKSRAAAALMSRLFSVSGCFRCRAWWIRRPPYPVIPASEAPLRHPNESASFGHGVPSLREHSAPSTC